HSFGTSGYGYQIPAVSLFDRSATMGLRCRADLVNQPLLWRLSMPRSGNRLKTLAILLAATLPAFPQQAVQGPMFREPGALLREKPVQVELKLSKRQVKQVQNLEEEINQHLSTERRKQLDSGRQDVR